MTYRESLPTKRAAVKNARERHDAGFERYEYEALAKIIEIDGSIDVPHKPGNVWVKEWGSDWGPTAVVRGNVTVKAGDWVKIRRNLKFPYQWQIFDMWLGGLDPADYNLIVRHLVAEHGENHQYPSEDDPGIDLVLVYAPAIQELKTTGDGATLEVITQACTYEYTGVISWFEGAVTDLTAYLPASGFAKHVLIYLDEQSGVIGVIEGDTVVDSAIITPPYPAVPSYGRASAFVRLDGDQTAVVTADDVTDARDFTYTGATDNIPQPTQDGQILTYSDGQIKWGNPISNVSGSIVVDSSGNMVFEV